MQTKTYAVLKITDATFSEIRNALKNAGYDHLIDSNGLIKLEGVALEKIENIPWF